jgi:hypothetical protein
LTNLTPTTPQPHGINEIEDYWLKESIKQGRVIADAALLSLWFV